MSFSAFRDHYTGSESTDAPGEVDSTLSTLSLRHFFTDRFSAGFVLPTGFLRFDPGGSSPVQRASGFGDAELVGRYAFRPGAGFKTHIDLEAALALPTGTSALSMSTAAGEAPPNILSVGRGAMGARARLGCQKFLAREWALRSWLGASAPATANASNIRFGTMVNLGIGGMYQPAPKWSLGPQVSGSFLTHARSSVNGQLVNSGGTWVHGALVVAYRVSDEVSISVNARAPVYRDVNGSQISETFTAAIQVGYQFGVEEDEHEHEHGDEHQHGDEHGDEHQHGDEHGHKAPHAAAHPDQPDAAGEEHTEMPGDVADLARGGASFDASTAPVVGKITIIDYWAEWCGPCKPVTHGLEELAASDARIALRKVEVPTFDTPVAKDHISESIGLPIVWIYDRTGTRVRVLEQKKLAEVLKAVDELLPPSH